MAANNADKFKKVAPNTGWQLDASGISSAIVTSFGLVNATGLPTGTGVKITVDRVDASGVKTPDKMERIDGVIDGTSVITCVRGVEGTAQAHGGGAVVEIVISADLWNDAMDGILVEHGQDGKHIAPTTAKTTPVDADTIGMFDSAASFVYKKLTMLNLKNYILSSINPIGTIREFNVATNPNTLLGFGTWAEYGKGKVTVAINATDTEFDTLEETGGAKTADHTHAGPSHTHGVSIDTSIPYNGPYSASAGGAGLVTNQHQHHVVGDTGAAGTGATGATAPSVLQPYIVVYRWVRTA